MKTINKELPKRFTEAVTKLYNAFHNGTLDAMNCSACAVGNICNNNKEWDDYGIFYSNLYDNGDYIWNPTDEEKQTGLEVIEKTGYSPNELKNVEILFIESCKQKKVISNINS